MTLNIPVTEIAPYLAMSPKTLQNWRLPGCTWRDRVMYVPEAAIDKLLVDGARNFPVPPTTQDLLHRRVILVGPEPAQTALEVPKSGLLRLVGKGQLAALKLSAALMSYSWQSVLSLQIPEGWVKIEEAEHILGLARYTLIEELGKAGRFTTDLSPINGHQVIAAMESITALLSEMLADTPWITPEDWIAARRSTIEPLLTAPQAAARLGVGRDELRRLLREQWIDYCRTPGRQRLICPVSLADYERAEQPMSDEQIGFILGGSATTVATWRHDGLLHCPLHEHPNKNEYRHICIVAITAALLNSGISAIEWCTNPRTSKPILLNQAVHVAQVPLFELQQLAESGAVPAIRTPGGSWAFRITVLRALRRSRRA